MSSRTQNSNPGTQFVRWANTIVVIALLLVSAGCRSDGSPASATESDRIFDERTSGKRLVENALALAALEQRNVLLLFGANWCPYCRQLHALLETGSTLSPVIRKSFVVVPVDVGTSARNRNVDLIDRYESNVFTDGTPSLVVLDSKGRRIAPTAENPWSARNPIEESRVLGFLLAGAGEADVE